MSDSYGEMAKVIRRLDAFKFVISRGSDAGVKVGDTYLMFRLGDNLNDPDTGEDLGPLEIVVGRAKVSHVQPRISTLESVEVTVVPGQRKIVRREPNRYESLFSNAPRVEEIEEGSQRKLASIDVAPGDFARPI
jgi:hypothetical protein